MAQYEERRRAGIRLVVLQSLIIVTFSVLAVSFWVLQVVQHEKFNEMAENNHQRTLALRAPRGVIFDRAVRRQRSQLPMSLFSSGPPATPSA